MPAKKTTILTADDDPQLLRLVARNLEFEDYAVLTASDGQQALDLIEQHTPDTSNVPDAGSAIGGQPELVAQSLNVLTSVMMQTGVVALSSCDVYRAYGRTLGSEPGPSDPTPLTEAACLREKLYPYRGEKLRSEEDPMAWMDNYDKILIERVVMGSPDLSGTILRLPMVYGPHDNMHRIFKYLQRMDEHRPVVVLGERFAHWLWTRDSVENVAAAIALAVTHPRAAGRIYNVGETQTLTIAEWVRAIGDAAEWHGTIITVPEEHLPTHLRSNIVTSQQMLIDTTRIREELGYHPLVSQGEALKQTVMWERANPPDEIDMSDFDYEAEDTIVAKLQRNS